MADLLFDWFEINNFAQVKSTPLLLLCSKPNQSNTRWDWQCYLPYKMSESLWFSSKKGELGKNMLSSSVTSFWKTFKLSGREQKLSFDIKLFERISFMIVVKGRHFNANYIYYMKVTFLNKCFQPTNWLSHDFPSL